MIFHDNCVPQGTLPVELQESYVLTRKALSGRMPVHAKSRYGVKQFSVHLLRALGTQNSHLLASMLAKGDDYGYIKAAKLINPSMYSDPLKFFLDYQAAKLVAKCPLLETGIDTEKVALKKFVEAEDRCRETNDIFRKRAAGHFNFRPLTESILTRASKIVTRILGDVPPFDDLDFRFGPGATLGVRGDTSVYNKLNTLECSPNFSHVVGDFLAEFPGWIPPDSTQDIAIHDSGELTFVLKNAETKRSIIIGANLDGMHQLGIGAHIRKRLKLFGVNLDDQRINKALAYHALKRRLSTVDFISASDLIAYGLVLDQCPIEWVEAMDVSRPASYHLKGDQASPKLLEKFSSMGVGYTFELETLLFLALAIATCDELEIEVQIQTNLHVYGDDVILPEGAFDLYSEVCEEIGFLVNKEKSFKTGRFFESCGSDFFDEVNVRPLFITRETFSRPLDFIYAANTVRRIARRISRIYASMDMDVDSGLMHRLDDVHTWCVSCIPHELRFVGPEGYGDGHLIGAIDEAGRSVVRHRTFDLWSIKTLVERPLRVEHEEWPSAYALYNGARQRSGVGTSRLAYLDGDCSLGTSRGYSIRNKTSVRKQTIEVPSQWLDPWGEILTMVYKRGSPESVKKHREVFYFPLPGGGQFEYTDWITTVIPEVPFEFCAIISEDVPSPID